MTETSVKVEDDDIITDRKSIPNKVNDRWAALAFLVCFSVSVSLAIVGVSKIAQADIWKYDPYNPPDTGYYYDTAYGWLNDMPINKEGYYFDHNNEKWIEGTPSVYIDPKSSLGATSWAAPAVSIVLGILLPIAFLGIILKYKKPKIAIFSAFVLLLVAGAYVAISLQYVGIGLRFKESPEYQYIEGSRIMLVIVIILISITIFVAFFTPEGPKDAQILEIIGKIAYSKYASIIGITSIGILAQITTIIILVLPLWGFFWVDSTSLLKGNYDHVTFWVLCSFQFFCLYWYSEVIRNIVHFKLSPMIANDILGINPDQSIYKSFGSICYAGLKINLYRSAADSEVKRTLILVALYKKDYNSSSMDSLTLDLKEESRLMQKEKKEGQGLTSKKFSSRITLYSWAIMLPIGLSVFVCPNFFVGTLVNGSLYGFMFYPYGVTWTFICSILAMTEFNIITQLLLSGVNTAQICSELDRKTYKKYMARIRSESSSKEDNQSKMSKV